MFHVDWRTLIRNNRDKLSFSLSLSLIKVKCHAGIRASKTSDCSFSRFVFLLSTRNHWKSFVLLSTLGSSRFSVRNPTRFPSSDLSARYQRRMAFSSQRAATRATTVSHIVQLASSFVDTINKCSIADTPDRSIRCKPFHLVNSFPNKENFYRWISFVNSYSPRWRANRACKRRVTILFFSFFFFYCLSVKLDEVYIYNNSLNQVVKSCPGFTHQKCWRGLNFRKRFLMPDRVHWQTDSISSLSTRDCSCEYLFIS